MKIVCISDTHNYHALAELPEGELLIHAGDITRRGRLEEVERFAAWLADLPFRYKVVIAGNHDWCFQKQAEEARRLLKDAAYLEDEALSINGLRLYGSPWQPEYHNWAFNLPRGPALAEKWAAIPKDTDILITHGPPLGFGDTIRSGQRVGDEDLLAAVKAIQPALHVFGHVHEDYGCWTEGPTTFVNASLLNHDFDPVNGAAHLELLDGQPKLFRPMNAAAEPEPQRGVYHIKVRRLETQITMCQRLTVAPQDMAARLGEVLPAIYQQIMSADSRPMGPPYVRYLAMEESAFELEAGLPVIKTFKGRGGVGPGKLRGGKAASTWHLGPYHELGAAHEALKHWVLEHNQQINGEAREVYATDPRAEADPERWRTQVILPLR